MAQLAGVSRSTASLVLSHGTRPVSDETRRRVEEAAAKLGYRSNAIARALRTGTSRLVAVVMDTRIAGENERATPFFLYRFLFALLAELSKDGIGLVLVTHETPLRFSSLPADAIFLLSTDPDYTPESELPDGVPIVAIGDESHHADIRVLVKHDHEAITREALDHLWSVGARRVGLVPRADAQSYVEESRSRYRLWCEQKGVEPRVLSSDGSAEGIREAVADAVRDDLDGIYSVCGDPLSVLEGVSAAGKRVPADVACVNLSEHVIEEALPHGLSTVSMEPLASAALVAEVLRNVSPGTPFQRLVLPHTFSA